MHRNSKNNYYRGYSYLPPSNSTSSRKTHDQYDDSRLPTQYSLYSNATPIVTYASPRFHQQHQPSTTTISDLAEPMSVFDDIKFPGHHLSNVVPFPPIYISPNPSRRTSVRDARFATASAMRERLLNDIQNNISEIDEELSLLERRRHVPSRLSSIGVMRQTSLDKKTLPSNDENQIWPNKPRRIYEVIPRITSQSKTISQYSTPKVTDRTLSYAYIGQYHYGPEIEEIEIHENDPENADLKSTIGEIPELSFHETLFLDQFRRQQSALPQNRVLIFVPEYGSNHEMELNETVEDLHQNNPIDTDVALLSTVKSSHHLGSANKINIQDFQSLLQTAPEPKIEIPPPSPVKPDEISDKNETDSINTMLSKPIKHSRLSIRTQESPAPPQQPIINTKVNTPVETAHFFSDYGNEDVVEEDLISLDPRHFALPTEVESVFDDNLSNTLIRPSQTSLLNPHSSQEQKEEQKQQQPIIEKNNEKVKEKERKKVDATTKHSISSTSKLPVKNTVPISIYDSTPTQSAKNKNNVKQNHRTPSTSKFNMNKIEPSAGNKLNNFSIELDSLSSSSTQKSPSKNMDSTGQRPAFYHISQVESSKILFRDQPIIPADIPETSSKQTEQRPVESRHNSALPVPLNSPDYDNIRPSTSRSTTPERRKSISSIDQNILLASTDLINFDNPSTDHFHINTERNGPSPLVNFRSISQEIQQNNKSNEIKLENHDQNTSVSLPTHNRLKSVSPRITETKKSERDDLRLPSISPRHSDASDANLTSVDREDTYRPPISPVRNTNELEKIENHSLPIEEEFPFITASQRRSKLSLIIRPPKAKEKKIINNQSIPQTHTIDFSSINNDKKLEEQRHVLFSNNLSQSRIEENSPLKNWRERVNKILAKRRFPHDKYAHIKSRVNSFANFDHQPKKIMFVPKNKVRAKILSNHQNDTKENKSKNRTAQSKQQIPLIKGSTSQVFGRVWCLPDGTPKIFHESLNWNVESKLKSYSMENFHYKTRRNNAKFPNKKFQWHSESGLLDLKTDITPRRQILTHTISLQTISDIDELNFYQQGSETERKIFDINSNSQQSISKFQESFLTTASFNSKRSDKIIFDEKLVWTKKSKLKDSIWKNLNYQPKKSTVQIIHQPTHWKSQSTLQITHSLTWDIQSKPRYWSEFDLHQLTKNKALFSQYHNPKWNDLITDNNYPLLSLTQDYVNDQLREEKERERGNKTNFTLPSSSS